MDFVHKDNLAKNTVFNYPRGSGKSVNVQSFSDYFQIPVDTNGIIQTDNKKAHLFDGLDVDRDATMKTHFKGKYPVISVSLGAVSGKSLEETKRTFILFILRGDYGVYSKHGYLRNIYRRKLENQTLSTSVREDIESQLAFFNKMLSGPIKDITDEDLHVSFRSLTHMLFTEFGKKVFIFIDEYDRAINEAFLTYNCPDQKDIVEFFRRFFYLTLQEENDFLKQSMTVGILRITKYLFDNVMEYNALNNRYFQYFGLTKKDVNDLVQKKGGISKKLEEEAEYYYDGYRCAYNLTVSLFNPWAIGCFFQTRAIGSYFEHSGSFAELYPIFGHESIWKDVRDLVNNFTVFVRVQSQRLDITDFKRLREMTDPECTITGDDKHLFYRLLFSTGYLTLDVDRNLGNTMMVIVEKAFLRVPNMLVKMELSKILRNNLPKKNKKF